MRKVIDRFVQDKNVGLVGASCDRKKFGNALLRELIKKGCRVYPVNSRETCIEETACYTTVKELPPDVKNVILTVPPSVSEKVVRECAAAGIKRVWLHRGAGGKGAVSQDAVDFCRTNGIEVVHGVCPLMFFPPAGIHRIHFLFRKWRGGLPKGF